MQMTNTTEPPTKGNARSLLARERGQTMVEFTLVLPVLLVVLFGIIQFGLTFNNYVALTDAVRAGARTAAVSRFSSTPQADTVNRVKNSSGDLDPTKVNVTVTATWAQGSDVVVKATYPYSISLLGLVVASGNLSSQTTERVE
jgi:Flp pilus assembly protein TadG